MYHHGLSQGRVYSSGRVPSSPMGTSSRNLQTPHHNNPYFCFACKAVARNEGYGQLWRRSVSALSLQRFHRSCDRRVPASVPATTLQGLPPDPLLKRVRGTADRPRTLPKTWGQRPVKRVRGPNAGMIFVICGPKRVASRIARCVSSPRIEAQPS